ncbi:hypothetical protein AB4Z52_34805 [Rhizobium sp. 2YAF20]|uniref:hypothetical protein n=1 Tax=Rhizobium sp. 2YAF20 TaxID=3233027 RepID=UPI003F99A953
MLRMLVSAMFFAVIWAASVEDCLADMSLVRGPGNTSIVVDPGCKVRDDGGNPPDPAHRWIDCLFAQKRVTLLMSVFQRPALAAKEFDFPNVGQIYAKATSGTEWSTLKDGIKFLGGPGMPGFEPIAQLRLIAELCEPKGNCTYSSQHRIIDFKVLGTPAVTVSLIVMGDVNENQILENGKLSATYWYFPDPISTMVETFNFATMPNPPY